MQHAIDSHRETVLDSPYSSDRAEAMEELSRVYPDAADREQRTVAETFRQVVLESAHRGDRDTAREYLLACFEADPDPIASVVVETLTELATDGKFSEDRLAAIDDLRDVYADLPEQDRDTVGKALAEIAGDGTYEDERNRARRRLSDVTDIEREIADDDQDDDEGEEAVGYLGQSLAEHLESAAHDSAETCRQRAEELSEFLTEHPVKDGAYDEVHEDVVGLLETFEALGTDGELTEDRIERVERIAARVERLYARE